MRSSLRVATPAEVLAYGARGGHKALRARGLLPPMMGAAGLTIDSSTPAFAVAATSTTKTITSPAFSPPAGSVLVAMLALPVNVLDGGQSTVSVTDNLGGHLGWAKLAGAGSFSVDAEVWWAACPSAQTNMTVTASTTGTTVAAPTIGVVVLTGAATTQNGASGHQTAGAAPSLTLVTTQAGSLVVGMVSDFSTNTTPTIPAGQSDVFNGHTYLANTLGGSSAWCQQVSALTGAAGSSVTINDTAPTTDNMGFVAAELLAAAAVASSPAVFPVFLPRRLGPAAVGPTFFAPFGPGAAAVSPIPGKPTVPAYLPRRLGPRAVGPRFFAVAPPAPAAPATVANQLSLSAALSFAGAQTRAISTQLAAALTFTGAQARAIAKLMTAALTLTGARALAIAKLIAATLSPTAARRTAIAYHLSATLAPAGALTRNVAKLLTAAVLSLTGALSSSRVVLKALGATLSLSAASAKQTSKSLAGALTFTGAQTRAVAAHLSAGLTFTGQSAKQIGKRLAAAGLSFTGAVLSGLGLTLPKITPPTTAQILAYFAHATVSPYTGHAAVSAYTSTSALSAYFSSANPLPYTASPAIVAYTSAAAVVSYHSTGRIGPTLG